MVVGGVVHVVYIVPHLLVVVKVVGQVRPRVVSS